MTLELPRLWLRPAEAPVPDPVRWEGAELIEQALDRLLGTDGSGRRRTAIIIAHKLSTVQRADRIAILDQGRLLETGRRTDLEADPTSAYARLLRTGLEEVMV